MNYFEEIMCLIYVNILAPHVIGCQLELIFTLDLTNGWINVISQVLLVLHMARMPQDVLSIVKLQGFAFFLVHSELWG